MEKLKQLLLHAEQEKIKGLEEEINKLYAQLQDKEQLLETLDPVIAELLYKKIHESKNQMADAIAPIMGPALRAQITEAKDDIADALYPVIGVAVRKSVAEAMKDLLRAINDRIDAVVNRGFWNRGRLDKNSLLRQSFPFSIQEVFLIHKTSGLLLSHASPEHNGSVNQDMISGMLTAIQEFSKTALGQENEGLTEIQYENKKIIIEDGKYAYLAFVTDGIPAEGFAALIDGLEEKIHLRWYKEMRAFEGDTEPFEPVSDLLNSFITSVHAPFVNQALESQKKNRTNPWLNMLILLFFVALIAVPTWWFINKDNKPFSLKNYVTEYNKQPLTSVQYHKQDDKLVLTGFIVQTQYNAFLQGLNGADIETDNSALFALPSQENLQSILAQIKKEFNLSQPLSLIYNETGVVLNGFLNSAHQHSLVTARFSQLSGLPLILTRIKIEDIENLRKAVAQINILFNVASAQIESAEKEKLDKLVADLQNVQFNRLVIHGHTDKTGHAITNQKLALSRSEEVRSYLEQKGFPLSKLVISAEKGMHNQEKSIRCVDFKLE